MRWNRSTPLASRTAVATETRNGIDTHRDRSKRWRRSRGVVGQDRSIGERLLLDHVGVVLLGGAEAVQKHQRDPGSVAVHPGNVEACASNGERQPELLEFLRVAHDTIATDRFCRVKV